MEGDELNFVGIIIHCYRRNRDGKEERTEEIK
jgi:hypothetical protein